MTNRYSISVAAFVAILAVVDTLAQSAVVAPLPQTIVLTTPGTATECHIKVSPLAPVSAVAFAPDGKTLAAGGRGEVVLWDLQEAKLARRLGADRLKGQVRGLAFLEGGRVLAAAAGRPSEPARVELLDVETSRSIATLEGPKDEILSIAVGPEGRLLAAGSADGSVYVWNLAEKRLVAARPEHGDWVHAVAFSPDGTYLASGGADRSVRLWDLAKWQLEYQFVQTDTVQGMAFDGESEVLAIAVGGLSDQSIRIRRRDSNPVPRKKREKMAQPATPVQNFSQQSRLISTGAGIPHTVVFNSLGNRVYVPASDKTVKVIAPDRGSIVANLAGHADWVHCVAVSPDATKLASGGADGTVRLWDASRNRLIATLVHVAPGTDRWVAVTAQGNYCGSAPETVSFRTADPKTAANQLALQLRSEEKVKEAIRAETSVPSNVPIKPTPKRDPGPGKKEKKKI